MTDNAASDRKGYRYYLSDEAILNYMKWPIAIRLTWLGEANRFLFSALSDETRKIRDALRRGEI